VIDKNNNELPRSLFVISSLVLLALIIRILLFSGFVLGDDPAYSSLIARILDGLYPAIGKYGVFETRPLTLMAGALPIYIFGWNDVSFVLVILLASLLNISIVYFVAYKLSGPIAAFFAAVCLAFFPIDMVHATTFTNDILLSMIIWTGGYILLCCYDKYELAKNLALIFLSGLIMGAGVAVKINVIVMPLIIIPLLLILMKKEILRGAYRTPLVWMSGWLIANFLICLFLYNHGGNAFANFSEEMNFNRDFNPSGYEPSILIEFLTYYPKLMLGIVMDGYQGYRFSEYGFFFLLYLLCIPLIFFKRFKMICVPAILALILLLIMEFAPQHIIPYYVPIHRRPTFLHIASIPAAVTIGIAMSVFYSMRKRIHSLAVLGSLILLIVTSSYWAWIKASFFRDSTTDQRWVWELVKTSSAKKVFTDNELTHYLNFRSAYKPPFKIIGSNKLPSSIPQDSLVLSGGARRPYFDQFYAGNFYNEKDLTDMPLLLEAPFQLKPWRLTPMRLYLTIAPSQIDRRLKQKL
jgi:hypothetical protein